MIGSTENKICYRQWQNFSCVTDMQCRTWNTGTYCGRDSKCGDLEQEEGDNRKHEENIVEEKGLSDIEVNDVTIFTTDKTYFEEVSESMRFHKEENNIALMDHQVEVADKTENKWKENKTTQIILFHESENQSHLHEKEKSNTFTTIFAQPEFERTSKSLTENIEVTATSNSMLYPNTKVLSLPLVKEGFQKK